uniref:Putative e3 ubiquitin-protein ligase rnf13 n=1 Tax=Ornithodoros turicata TaxID=34597 RepID=A0A2R5LGQ8_9ACAR
MFPHRRMPCHITILYVYSIVSMAALFHATLVAAEIVVIPPSNSTPEVKHILDQELSFSALVPEEGVPGLLTVASPITACEAIAPPPFPSNDTFAWFVLIARFECSLGDKARYAQEAGYDVAVIYDRKVHINPREAQQVLKHDSDDVDVNIYAVMVSEESGIKLRRYTYKDDYQVKLYPENFVNLISYVVPFLAIIGLCTVAIFCYVVGKYVRDWCKRRKSRLSKRHLRQIPTTKYKKGDAYETCAICIEDYVEGDKLRVLPCSHAYHCKCIDTWLLENRRTCPICKRKVRLPGMPPESESDDDDDDHDNRAFIVTERTPLLLSSSNAAIVRPGGTFQDVVHHSTEGATAASSSPSAASSANVTITRANLHGEAAASHSCPTTVSTVHSVNCDASTSDDEAALLARTSARSLRRLQQRRARAMRARRAAEEERMRRGETSGDLHV